jgi:predicted DNA-binding transcriptional regulator YafY
VHVNRGCRASPPYILNSPSSDRSAEFDAKRHLARSIGHFASKQDIEVRLAFAAKAVGYAQDGLRRFELPKWTAMPDSRTELTLCVNNYSDIKNEILGYGQHVEVLAPDRLQKKVSNAHKVVLALHARGASGETA